MQFRQRDPAEKSAKDTGGIFGWDHWIEPIERPPTTMISTSDNKALSSLSERRTLMPATEVALDLRCSKAHVHHLIKGAVTGARALPAVRMAAG